MKSASALSCASRSTICRRRPASSRGKEALKLDPPPGRRNVHESTIVSVFKTLRTLIRWMEVQGYRRFADLDRDGCDRFLAAAMAQCPGSKPGKMLKATTLQTYVNLLTRLYLQGAKCPEVAIADPFPATAPPFARRDRGWLPYTPDAVAVPLISAALRLIEQPADDVIALQTQAQAAYDDALAKGISQTTAGFIMTDAIAPFFFSTLPGEESPWHEAPVTKQVRYLAARIYDVCFVVIAYLVGARVSEILGLQVGCIEQHSSTGSPPRGLLKERVRALEAELRAERDAAIEGLRQELVRSGNAMVFP
ncbi:hypothetical protein I6F11_26765 [Ensifer sp. NBAIM29]|nr:hypothetical protein [Ensifer sp. NBAIM29]